MQIEIRGDNVVVSKSTRELIEKRCRFAFGRIAAEVGHVRIVVRDLNGPRNGVDIESAVDIRLSRGAEVRAAATDVVVERSADRAIDRAARAAHRLIARRRDVRRDSIRTTLEVYPEQSAGSPVAPEAHQPDKRSRRTGDPSSLRSSGSTLSPATG
ncbi:MAG TPA: HPF/RaiA family ribosome-associated protein [Thermoanaerobaculia bacterium]|nr:HPF/RaiA family ribosome-associated protein [Thermoanaerobaculia bacterium]